jgi:hypothetical protein
MSCRNLLCILTAFALNEGREVVLTGSTTHDRYTYQRIFGKPRTMGDEFLMRKVGYPPIQNKDKGQLPR